uniref:Choline transporter-like protein n=1 Tax=Aegilops tauschii subsp. strangulata TaxID=200361 RepID=A0A453S4Z2_AEGTS
MQHDIPFHTVVSSLKRLLRYSLGSVALGSLVVSSVEWVRCILKALRRRLKGVDSTGESRLGKTVSSSSHCCLGCIDWTIKSVNRNAYIVVSTNSPPSYSFVTTVLCGFDENCANTNRFVDTANCRCRLRLQGKGSAKPPSSRRG